tara:strand:+ start:498 stop:956 length:459 start_codon:yes stop_codon:yes gene_type:complete
MKKLLIIIFLLTISCSNNKVVKNHGLNALELKANKIEISKTNKNDILGILGKPSTVSLFDENLWVYIQTEKVNQSVFKLGKSKINLNNVLEIHFNNHGIVNNKKLYKVEDMNDLKAVKNITEIEYNKSSSIGKLFKSIEQKINSPTRNKKRR